MKSFDNIDTSRLLGLILVVIFVILTVYYVKSKNNSIGENFELQKASTSRYLLHSAGENRCPTGYESVSENECYKIGKSLVPSGKKMGRGLQVGGWSWVPPGCSLQSSGDWAPHFNTDIDAKNDGSYSKVCEKKDKTGLNTYTFTNAGATGRLGPTKAQIDAAYKGTNLKGKVNITKRGIQEWRVPVTGKYKIEVWGAKGGDSKKDAAPRQQGGKGARMVGSFDLKKDELIKILVGQEGTLAGKGGGGGGGSYVVRKPYNTTDSILIIAGGGGGTHYNGNNGKHGQQGINYAANSSTVRNRYSTWYKSGSGGSFLTDGASFGRKNDPDGQSFIKGGIGGKSTNTYNWWSLGEGGFGGGGAGSWPPGSGGGFKGGVSPKSGGNRTPGGSGGSSKNNGTEQINSTGFNDGHGKVIITQMMSAEELKRREEETERKSLEGRIREARERGALDIMRKYQEKAKQLAAKNALNKNNEMNYEASKITDAANKKAALLANKNAQEEIRLRSILADQAAAAAAAAEKLALQTNNRAAAIEAAKKKGIAEAAANAAKAARERFAEERRRRLSLRDKQRLREWDELHNRDFSINAPEFDSKNLDDKIDIINNNIMILENRINNINSNLGSCPDGWSLVKSQNGLNYCNSDKSANYSKKCNATSKFSIDETDENKLKWARNCRVNWTNRKKINVGERAPMKYNVRLDQMMLYNDLKKLLMIKNSLLVKTSQNYYKDTSKLSENTLHLDKSKKIIMNQLGEINNNKEKLRRLENDITTLTKKIRIGENKYQIQTYSVFFLKYSFVFMLVILLIGLLMKNGLLSKVNGAISGMISMSMIIIRILYEVWKHRNNNENVFHKTNWNTDRLDQEN